MNLKEELEKIWSPGSWRCAGRPFWPWWVYHLMWQQLENQSGLRPSSVKPVLNQASFPPGAQHQVKPITWLITWSIVWLLNWIGWCARLWVPEMILCSLLYLFRVISVKSWFNIFLRQQSLSLPKTVNQSQNQPVVLLFELFQQGWFLNTCVTSDVTFGSVIDWHLSLHPPWPGCLMPHV